MAFPTDGSRYHTAAPNAAIPSAMVNSIQDAVIEASKLNSYVCSGIRWSEDIYQRDGLGGYYESNSGTHGFISIPGPIVRYGGSVQSVKFKYYVSSAKGMYVSCVGIAPDLEDNPTSAPPASGLVAWDSNGDSETPPYWKTVELDLSIWNWTAGQLGLILTAGNMDSGDRIAPPVAYGYMLVQP